MPQQILATLSIRADSHVLELRQRFVRFARLTIYGLYYCEEMETYAKRFSDWIADASIGL